MSSHPFYQPPTLGRKIVHSLAASLYYCGIWLALIIGAPALVFLIVGR
jgi:hypothetical protein